MGLRHFSKLTCFSTLFLIFAGGMVTSTGSGLAVPDWPLSYGSLFPPMVGGVFYEHGHRMVASFVGLLTLILAIWITRVETRRWVKILGFSALGAVILQGLLGGLTVLLYLPTAVSAAHALLAQTFFILTIIIAYSLSAERERRDVKEKSLPRGIMVLIIALIIFIYCQLFLGALMRHTESGLAIMDFPTAAGKWWPAFDATMLAEINKTRFEYLLDPVSLSQVKIHFQHRLGAVIIFISVCVLNVLGLKYFLENRHFKQTLLLLDCLIGIQIFLGIATVLTLKSAVITSLHVVCGAATLGTIVLLYLRTAPLTWAANKQLTFKYV